MTGEEGGGRGGGGRGRGEGRERESIIIKTCLQKPTKELRTQLTVKMSWNLFFFS